MNDKVIYWGALSPKSLKTTDLRYLIRVVIDQAPVLHGTFPPPHGGRDGVTLRLPREGLPEEGIKSLPAVGVTAAPHRPHQGEGEGRLQEKSIEVLFQSWGPILIVLTTRFYALT